MTNSTPQLASIKAKKSGFQDDSIKKLVSGLKSKDTKAIEAFYLKYSSILYGYIKKTLLDDSLSAQTFVETCKQIILQIERFDSTKESFVIWSYKIAAKETSKQKVNILLRQIFSA